jgi:lauroyl/myristoyl acyltransferase
MGMLAALALNGYKYVQYAARGLAPAEVAAAHPEVFGHNRLRLETRQAREAAEDRLPARYLTLETPVRELVRSLKRGEIVGIAYDGRLGARFAPVSYLGRTALLSPGPLKLAILAGAPIVPAFNLVPEEGPAICAFGSAIWPEDQRPEALMERFLRRAAEPWLRAHPGSYGLWLLHCLDRAGVDDHPLFIDYAPDDRYERWL